MNKPVLWVFGAISFFALITGCKKDPIDNLSGQENQVYVSNYDSSANFKKYRTFYVDDSIVEIQNGQVQKGLAGSDGQAFIAAVKSQMKNAGYTLADSAKTADLGIELSFISNTSTQYYAYSDYWSSYGSYWDAYYWGYSGFYGAPSYFGAYEITDQAVSIDMIDLTDSSATKAKVVWNGLIRASNAWDGNGASYALSNLFEQSPYLSASTDQLK